MSEYHQSEAICTKPDRVRRRLLRFADLKARGVVTSWPQLYRLIRDHTFPAGFHLGVNTRVWDEDVVEAWLEIRRNAAQQRADQF